MAKKLGAHEYPEGEIYANIEEDGSLIILSRGPHQSLKGMEWRDETRIPKACVEPLRLYLNRAAEHRNEAESEEQTCPVCRGRKQFKVFGHWQDCTYCDGTGHV